MKLWTFRTKNFVVRVSTSKDTLDGSYMEPALVQECKDKIRSGEWKCFQTEVEVEHRLTRETLATTYLGGSIYADPKDFIDHRGMNARGHGSYFSQMVREACDEARKTLKVKRTEAARHLANLNSGRSK